MLNKHALEFTCEQFIWGKIICDGKDVSGYALIAHSSTLTEETCRKILSRSSGGISYSILQGEKGFAFFNMFSNVVFSCTERSAIPEGGGRYFVQTRYLVMPWESFEEIGADFRFLASQAENVPVLDGKTELRQIKTTYKLNTHRKEEVVRRILKKYEKEMLAKTLLAANSHHPIAIFAPQTGNDDLLEFFQALILLLPPESRRKLTFATLCSASDTGPYKVKVNPTGALTIPHIIVRPQDAVVSPASLLKSLPRDNGWIHERMAEFLAN